MFRLGCDPECFLMRDGHLISAVGRIGGSKYEPKAILEQYMQGFALQEDNVLMEYNIPPASTFNEFTDHLDLIHEYIDRMLLKDDITRGNMASAVMPPDEMNQPEAWIFGCEPDFDAWTLKVNPRPGTLPNGKCVLDENPLFRSAGGHLHIGLDAATKSIGIATIRWLDRLVGSFLAKRDPNKERRQLYGLPGAMRFKKYGVEWRSPSNWWTFQHTETLREMWGLIEEAVARGANGQINDPRAERFDPKLLLDLKKLAEWERAF